MYSFFRFFRQKPQKPYIGYQPWVSSGFYQCRGCFGSGYVSRSDVIHSLDCPHYPSEGNRKLEERLKNQDRFRGST